MATTVRPPFMRPRDKPLEPTGGTEHPLMRKADRLLFVGIVLGGSWILGPIAIPFLVAALLLMNKAQKSGVLYRPWSVTLIGSFVLIDASVNYFGWGTDLLWSHDTTPMQTLWPGYGKLVDGAYYIDYNGGPLGGLSNYSEKTLEVFGVLVMYPMRIAAAWAFIKMKRWGLQMMIVTSWMYVGFWVAYVANLYQDYDARIAASDFGNIGIWFILMVYATPFCIMPYLYTVNRELFADTK